MRKKLFVFIGIILAAVLLAACGKTKYEVSFDVKGGTPAIAAVKVEKGKLVKEPTAPTKADYEFVGWFLDGEEWDFATDKVTKKMTLVAQWEASEPPVVTFTVTFDTDGGAPAIPPVTVESGNKVTKPTDPTKSGYTFSGWYVGNVLFNFNNAVTADVTLKAKWEAAEETVEVAFDVRGGEPLIDAVTIGKGEKVTKPADPTREGWNFAGWTLNGVDYDFNDPVDEDILLQAKWIQKVMVTITLVADGGEPAPDSPVQHEKGTVFAEPAEMTKDSYEFIGWFNQLTDEEYNFSAPVEESLILTAKWERIYEDFTVSFDIGYEEGEEVESQTVKEESKAVEPEIDERLGYRFMGWFLEDATVAYDFTKLVFEDLHLTARWHLEHVVTFDINYAEGTSPAPLLILDGEKVTAPTIAPREFYEFLGWFLEDVEEAFDFNTPITESIHLIGEWEELVTYAINYHNTDETMFVYGTKEAMVEAYLLDFYAFTNSSFSLSDFMHGPGKTSGYDGLWQELNTQIYSGQRPDEGVYNDSFFAYSHAYKDKWMPFHDMMEEFVVITNDTQFFWGAGTWTGLIRLRQYLAGIRPGGNETAEDMLMMPDPLIQNPPITEHLGIDAIILPEPYRVDAEFLGWYLEADFSGEAITEIPANTKEDIDLYANWDEANYYNVSFDIGYAEGESPATQNILDGKKASKPADPARRPGFRFEGWFEAEASVPFDFSSLITAPVALEAKWREVVEYKVTFDYDIEDFDDVIVWLEEGEALTEPTKPTKLNHKFLGWYLGLEEYDFEAVINDDLVLKAKWEELNVFTITYNLPEGAVISEGFATRDAMLQAFMEDFYQFLVDIEALDGEAISANDFIHGTGKTAGYDGMYLGPDENTSYFQKLYVVVEGVANLGIAPETGAFINQPEYNVKWMPVMNQIEEYSQLADDAGFFASKYIAYRRFQPYLQGKNLWSNKVVEAAEIFATIPNEYAVPRYEYNSLDATFYLPQATHPELFFNGWYDNAEFDGEPIDKVVTGSTGNIELFANFGVPLERYKVEFDLDYDDLTLEDIFVTQGNLLSKPQDPVRHLYKFLGWALEGETELFNFEEDLITEDSKLVAQWEELDPMAVTFDLGYEGGTPPPGVIVGKGTKVTKPADPVREGYIFLGWFLEDEEYDFNLPVEADITLVAHWEEAPFELTFDLDGGYLSALDLVEFMENTLVKADKYTNTVDWSGKPLILGHTFAGTAWSKMGFKETEIPGVYELVGKDTGYVNANATMYLSYHDNLVGDYVAIIKEIYKNIEVGDLMIIPNLPAELIDEEVELYFLKSGVSIPTELSVIPENITELITPVKEGYEFAGWFKDAELTEELTEVPVLTDDLTVYPKWEAKTYYEVTFDTDGGSEIPAQEVEEGQLVVKPADPVKEGYVFLGWLVDSEEYLFDEPVEGDFEIVASWRALEEFDVTFDLAYDGAPEPTVVQVTEFAKVSKPADPVREGHLFDGWFTDEELTQAYDFNTPVEANLTLYAKWDDEVITVEVKFDLNYEGAAAMTPVVIAENTKVTKPADPVREGYVFLGWFEDEAENAFDFDTLVEADLALEARWLEIVDYTITYELNGGNFLGDYADKDAMIDALLDDFYAYLELTSDMDEFKHGEGKTSGFDGTWHSVHKARLYTASRPSAVNEDFFISSAAYMEKWLPFFDNLETVVVGINNTQSFWGSTWTGLMRFREYIINDPVRPQHDWLPAEYFPPKAYQNISEAIELINPVSDVAFEGWYLEADFSGEPITEISANQTGNLTLYAKWQEATYYEVTFDSNGGSEVPSAQVEEGQLVLEPADPTKENYVFVGWFVPDAETAYDFNTPVIADLVLEARWEEEPKVIYDLGEYGYLSEEDKDSLLLAFVADYKELYGRTGVTVEQLYGSFAVNSYIPHDIKDIFQPEYKNGKWAWILEYFLYLANEADYDELDKLEAWNQTTWRTNIEAFIEEKQFNYASASESMDFSTEDAINGFWRFTSYNLVVNALEDPLLDGNTISLWKEGYEFAGWYDNPEFDGEAITEIPAVLDGHYKLYAQWVEELEPAEEALAEFDFTKLTEEKGKAIQTEERLKEVFNIASDDLDFIVGAHVIAGIYEGNGSGGGDFASTPGVIKTGTASAKGLLSLILDEDVSKVVLTLRGWTATDKVILNGVEQTAPSELGELVFELVKSTNTLEFEFINRVLITKISLYYDEEVDVAEAYTVTFDTDGGDPIASQTVREGRKMIAPTPTKEGYDFVEWRLEGVAFDINDPITQNMTLVAIWESDEITGETTVRFEYPGGNTTNMTAGNNAATVGLNPSIFTVTSTERVLNPLHVGLNTNGQTRLYSDANGDGNILTVEVEPDYVITEIKIKFGSTVNPLEVKAGSTEIYNDTPTANGELSLQIDEVGFSLQHVGPSGQIYIEYIDITFEPVAP